MKIGYAIIHSIEKDLSHQIRLLKLTGCKWIIKEHISVLTKQRPEFNRLLQKLKMGDTLIVQNLTCIGRSIHQVLDILELLHKGNIGFISIEDEINTNIDSGHSIKLIRSICQFDKTLISERTKAGILQVRKKGIRIGKQRGLSKEAEKIAKIAKVQYFKKNKSIVQICKELEISRSSFYRYVKT
jgi:DNA invertase Pin-like site-specific DNA recombinase